MQPQDPLLQLRDIHTMDTLSALLQTPSTWLGLLLVTGLITLTYYALNKRYSKNAFKREAIENLEQLSLNEENTLFFIQSINRLLKQTALATHPKENFARLTGNQWLLFLDRTGNTNQFTEGNGKILGSGPYQSNPIIDDHEKLLNLAINWVREQKQHA